MKESSDTIAAIATAPGEGAIAIVRVSGPASLAIADRVFRGKGPPPSRRGAGTFVHGHVVGGGQVADEVILLLYRAPSSYTREDCVEIQGHGGTAAAQRILRAVLEAGARPAEPGEFTKRAFLNGRIDLLQAEAVLDLIRARSDRAAEAALDQLSGSLSRTFGGIYDRLLEVAADIETTLDFSEEELPPTVLKDTWVRLKALESDLDTVLKTWGEGHKLREGVLVVIGGRPNVGKSTLLNGLLGIQRAIVHDTPGTTRDFIEEQMVINGYPVRIVDTAGLRQTECEVEGEGVRRARDYVRKADVLIYVLDASREVAEEDRVCLQEKAPSKTLVVINKSDLEHCESIRSFMTVCPAISCSLLTGNGLEAIRQAIAGKISSSHAIPQNHAVISERHRRVVVLSRKDIMEAVILLERKQSEVTLAASHIRSALELLGEVTGRVYHDELLTNIFSRFCIGK